MTRSRLPDVETLACAVAGEYAARWARSVARLQARADDADAPAPWLVDGFAGADLQRAAMRGDRIQPPAAAFARAAGEALGGAARVVLVEEDPVLLARVEDGLRAAGAEPRRAANPADAAPGEIVLVEAPFASVASRLAAEIADGPALVRLAPLSARALPWTALELLADLSGTDLLLRFPQEDFAKAGSFGGPLADFPPHLRRVVEGCSAFFADERHGWLLAWREAARAGGGEAALAGAVERLRAMLGNGGEERIARAARLEGAGGGAVHVLLSTPHPEHALELNGAAIDGGAPPPARSRSARPAAGRKSAPAAIAAAPESAAPASESPPPTGASSPETAPAAGSAAAPREDTSAAVDAAASAEAADGAASTESAADAATLPEAALDDAASSGPALDGGEARQAALDAAASADTATVPREPAASAPAASNVTAAPSVPARRDVPPEPAAPEAPPALLDLFALEPAPLIPEFPRGLDLRAIADDLHERHAGRRVPFRELLVDLADAGLAPEQVRTALGLLKRDRRAAYRSLDAQGAEVEFLAEPAAPPPPPAPRPRKPRKPVPGVLGLFDEPEPGEEPGAPPSTGTTAAPEPAAAESADAEATGSMEADAPGPAPAPEPAERRRRRRAE